MFHSLTTLFTWFLHSTEASLYITAYACDSVGGGCDASHGIGVLTHVSNTSQELQFRFRIGAMWQRLGEPSAQEKKRLMLTHLD